MSPLPFSDHDGRLVCNDYNDITLEISGLGDFARIYRSDHDIIQIDLYSKALPIEMKIMNHDGDNVTDTALPEMISCGLDIIGFEFEHENYQINRMFARNKDFKIFSNAVKEAVYTIEQKDAEPFLFDLYP
jgi:hypothetical protein